MTAKTGTARKKPTNPKTAPPKITTEMTHKGDRPTQGPITFPSNCCKSKIKRATQIACIGLINKVIAMGNIAPIIGPKYGIILVIKIINANNATYGVFKK